MTTFESAGLERPEGLVDLVYESMLEPAALPQVLAGLARATGADCANLWAVPPLNRAGFWIAHDIDRSAIDAYEQYYQRLDPWRAAFPLLAPGTSIVVRGEDLLPEETVLRSEFFTDFLLPNRVQRVCGVLVRPEAPWAPTYALSVFRAPGREFFEPDVVRLLDELGRHLLRVERLGTAALLAGSDSRGDAAFFLGTSGRLIQCNRAAEELIVDSVVLPGVRTIAFSSQALNLWFHGLLTSPQRLAGDRARHRTTVRFPGHGDLEFELTALRGHAPTPVLRVAPMMLRVRRAVRNGEGDAFARHACGRFGLTASEIDILQRLAAGATVAEIASARASSPETVRSHIKSAKRKTGIGRQVDLVRLVLRLNDEDIDSGAH
ncbi:MAG: hypothetical protein KJZ83_11460 [Burkholderiaceae bacterium]|nr:hypothetical protein [Burkholderiaceae bacterium]